jgi:mevalonate pyrophosphate decarboxylase
MVFIKQYKRSLSNDSSFEIELSPLYNPRKYARSKRAEFRIQAISKSDFSEFLEASMASLIAFELMRSTLM